MNENIFVALDRQNVGIHSGDYMTIENSQIVHLAGNKENHTKCGREFILCSYVEFSDFRSKCKRCFPITKYPRGNA